MDVIEFAGVTSSSLGVIVDGYYTKGIPQRRVTVTSIPGRSGSMIEDEGVYENSTQEYTLYWLPEKTKDSDVLNWLKQDGYYRWKHSDMPEYHHLARAILPSQVTNHRDCYHELKVTFSCKPEMYLDSGDTPIILFAPRQLRNPTMYPAKPKITLYGNTSNPSALTVNSVTMTISQIDRSLTLDCDIQEAYQGSINKNNTISGDFPVFPGGEIFTLGFSSEITKVEIQPRWWTL